MRILLQNIELGGYQMKHAWLYITSKDLEIERQQLIDEGKDISSTRWFLTKNIKGVINWYEEGISYEQAITNSKRRI